MSKITFDKTGTLTYGQLQVVKAESADSNYTDEDIYSLAAIAEVRSEHPLGKAIVNCYKQDTGKVPAEPGEFEMLPGRGIKAASGDIVITAGNKEMTETGADLSAADRYLDEGCPCDYSGAEPGNGSAGP